MAERLIGRGFSVGAVHYFPNPYVPVYAAQIECSEISLSSDHIFILNIAILGLGETIGRATAYTKCSRGKRYLEVTGLLLCFIKAS